jgi:hypothetical protein
MRREAGALFRPPTPGPYGWHPSCRHPLSSPFIKEQIVLARKPESKKKGGRPATGRDPMVGLRLSPEKRRQIEEWAGEQEEDKPAFSEAVRRLLDIGLDAAAKRKW